MEIKKLTVKYLILLLIYLLIIRFIEPYGIRLYYTLAEHPTDNFGTVNMIQSAMLIIHFLIGLAFVIMMLIDTRAKKIPDWLIIAITFFSPDIGILLFIIWQVYKELSTGELIQNKQSLK